MQVRPGRAGALVDSPDGVVISDLPPGGRVTVEASLDLTGLEWTCRGTFVADADGVVDTSRDASHEGTYTGVDPFGLFWSADVPRRPDLQNVHPLNVRLRATCDDLSGEASYQRHFLLAGIADEVVGEDGVVGRLFLPSADGSARPLVLLSGSEGGVAWPLMGALLASHGLAVLCLAHFNHPGTPDDIDGIDVEVVGRACDWLRTRRGVDDVPPSVVGISAGGELALLAASLQPDKVGPAISLVGSAVAWAAWRFEGQPLPHVIEDDDPFAALDDAEQLSAAEIPVERATGPVLLLSGEEDGFWPSARLSRIAVDRARRHGAGDKVVHVAYPDAGHSVGVPPGFAMPSVVHFPDVTLRPGGTRAGNQAARVDGWRRILEHVGAPTR